MRDSDRQKGFRPTDAGTDGQAREVPFDGRTFFESFYAANVDGEPEDHMTIGWITEAEAAFHYNVVENGIIRALLRRSPPPANAMVPAWRAAMRRSGRSLLDVGSGTGHWVDFMRRTFYVKRCAAVELTERMSSFLQQKYADTPEVTVLRADIADPGFGPDRLGGPVDFVTAIGVMFHIVDDERWSAAVQNLGRCLLPGGVLLVGEEAAARTANKEFHHTDAFGSWKEFRRAAPTEGEIRVNKRVRSIADWSRAAEAAGLRLIDVVRSDRDPVITTPENDLLVFEKS
jgi:SAM-dependent methyltransferase